jgi:hypothetical protein
MALDRHSVLGSGLHRRGSRRSDAYATRLRKGAEISVLILALIFARHIRPLHPRPTMIGLRKLQAQHATSSRRPGLPIAGLVVRSEPRYLFEHPTTPMSRRSWLSIDLRAFPQVDRSAVKLVSWTPCGARLLCATILVSEPSKPNQGAPNGRQDLHPVPGRLHVRQGR